MDLNDILANIADQDRGTWCDIVDPVDGTPTGIRVLVAGPDSETQHKARLRLSDDLAELADLDGRVSAENREKVRIASLARCVLNWEIEEDGKALPFSHAACVRVLSAASWIQAQVDAFASDRRLHRKG
jgi:hypothetical protein